jgi:SOS-response transcriptional repressor LexA
MHRAESLQQQAWAALLRRIRDELAKPGSTQAGIAGKLGVHRSVIFKWLSGDLKGRRVSVDDMRRYFRSMNLDPAPYFGGGEDVGRMREGGEPSERARKLAAGAAAPAGETPGRAPSVAAGGRDEESSEGGGVTGGRGIPGGSLLTQADYYSKVPWLEAVASMGGGSVETSRALTAHLAFRTEWLRSKGSLQGMVVINASGDSMSPTIPDGAVVLVNENDKRPVNNGIFFVCCGEELFLKRLKTDRSGRVTHLVSDLDGWEKAVDPAEYFEIIGRALWYAREL